VGGYTSVYTRALLLGERGAFVCSAHTQRCYRRGGGAVFALWEQQLYSSRQARATRCRAAARNANEGAGGGVEKKSRAI